jgi:hypothetical protein
VTYTSDGDIWQLVLDRAPQGVLYYSDASQTYDTLIYRPGIHIALPDKSQTYRVEGDNAELRHYLARLARRSRCFSRCIKALYQGAGTGREAVRLRLEPTPTTQTTVSWLSGQCERFCVTTNLDTPPGVRQGFCAGSPQAQNQRI